MTTLARTPLVTESDDPRFAAFRAAALLHRHLKFNGPDHEKTSAALKHAVDHLDNMGPAAQKLVKHAMKRVVQHQVAGDMRRPGSWRLTAAADYEFDKLLDEACADIMTLARQHGGTDDTPGFHSFADSGSAGRFAQRAKECGHSAQVIGSKAGRGGLTVQLNPRKTPTRSELLDKARIGARLDRERLALSTRSRFEHLERTALTVTTDTGV